MPAVTGVTNNGVILRGLSTLPSATEMLTVDPTGLMGRQAIPVGAFGSLTGSPSDNAALAAALAGKVSLSGDTMTGQLNGTSAVFNSSVQAGVFDVPQNGSNWSQYNFSQSGVARAALIYDPARTTVGIRNSNYSNSDYTAYVDGSGNFRVRNGATYNSSPVFTVSPSGSAQFSTLGQDVTMSGNASLSFKTNTQAEIHGSYNLGLFSSTATALHGLSKLTLGQNAAVFNWLNTSFAETDGLVAWGGTSASYPALKRSGTTLKARLANDSADAPFTAAATSLSGSLTLNYNSVNTSLANGAYANSGALVMGGSRPVVKGYMTICNPDGTGIKIYDSKLEPAASEGLNANDNAWDIGVAGYNRFRHLYMSGNVVAGPSSAFEHYQRTRILSPSNGKLQITNNAGTSGVQLDFATNGTMSLRDRTDAGAGNFNAGVIAASGALWANAGLKATDIGPVSAGSFTFSDGFNASRMAMLSRFSAISGGNDQLRLNTDVGIIWASNFSTNSPDIWINRESAGLLRLMGQNGVKVQNMAGTAWTPIQAGAITANGDVARKGSINNVVRLTTTSGEGTLQLGNDTNALVAEIWTSVQSNRCHFRAYSDVEFRCDNGVTLKNYANTNRSDFFARNIGLTGTLTHGFQSLVADPSTVDITNGLIRAVKNTTSGELRFWANDGNVMKSILFS